MLSEVSESMERHLTFLKNFEEFWAFDENQRPTRCGFLQFWGFKPKERPKPQPKAKTGRWLSYVTCVLFRP